MLSSSEGIVVSASMYDIAPKPEWDADLADGYIRRQVHPTLPLAILNYAPKTQWERAWRPTTLASRGLIVHAGTGEIVARPFVKFFNHSEAGAPTPALDARVRVMDKADGSLAVLYPVGDGTFAIATRGSFGSEQAQHATGVWSARYADRFTPRPGLTYLFEIVYPENRIVLDYRGMDDLILLDVLDTATGATVLDELVRGEWPGPVVEMHPFATFGDVLAADIPDDREGFVVHLLDTDERAKLKGASYKRLHSLMTEVSTVDLWENLAAARMLADGLTVTEAVRFTGMPMTKAQAIADAGSDWLAPLLDAVPDEFYAFVTSSIAEWEAAAEAFVAAHRAEFDAIELPGDPRDRAARKDVVAALARAAGKDKKRFHAYLALADGRSLLGPAFQSCKPTYAKAFWNEDTAA